MANKILTIDMITNEALSVFMNNLVFANRVNRKYDGYFAKSGQKIGRTIRIRKPGIYTSESGRVLNDIQDLNEDEVTLTIKQEHVAVEITQDEMMFDLDMFSERVLKPMIVPLANKVDADGLALAREIPTTAGRANLVADKSIIWLDAAAKLDNNSAPRNDRYAVVSPRVQAGLVENLKGLFNAAQEISNQYKKGEMATALGFEFGMDQNVVSHQFGTGVGDTVTVDGADQTGTSLKVTGLTGTLNVGDTFTIDGVKGVNMVSKVTTGEDRQFTVVAVNNAKTAITISPSLVLDGPEQSVNALPANGAALKFVGADMAGEFVEYNLAYQKDAFTLAMVDASTTVAGAKAYTAKDEELGITMTVTQQFDIRTYATITRIDIFYGWAVTREEFACKVVSSKTALQY